MANRSLDLELLLRIAGQVDPSVASSFGQALQQVSQLNLSSTQLAAAQRQLANALPTPVLAAYNVELAQLAATSDYAQQRIQSLASAMQQQAGGGRGFLDQIAGSGNISAFEQALQSASSGIQRFFSQVAAFSAGNLIADFFEQAVKSVGDFITSLASIPAKFTEAAFNAGSQFQFFQAQLEAVTGSATKARDAFEFAQNITLKAPLANLDDSVRAIQRLTIAGLDYSRWLQTVENTAAVTAKSIDQVPNRIEAITQALSEIAAGGTARGIGAFERLGINVSEAGLQMNKAGGAAESTRVILEKLQTFLDTRFGTAVERMSLTWANLTKNVQVLGQEILGSFGQAAFQPLIESFSQLFNSLAEHAPDLRAFASVLGEGVGSGIQQLLAIVQQGLAQLVGQSGDWEAAGARLIVSFGDGIVQAASQLLAIVASVAQAIANFLIGLSPPPEGPLSQITVGGVNTMQAYAAGLQAGGQQAVQAAQRVASGISGALQGAATYGPNLADFFGSGQATNVQALLSRTVSAAGDLLNRIHVVGIETAQAYLDGFRTGFDLSPLQRIMSAVDAIIRYGVDTKQISQSQVGNYISNLRDLLYRAALEVQEFGTITQTTLAAVDASFGVLAENVQRVLQLMGAVSQIDQQIAAAQGAVQSAEAAVKSAEDKVRLAEEGVRAAEAGVKQAEARVKAAEQVVKLMEESAKAAEANVKAVENQIQGVQNTLKQFELDTQDIPERFTRGRKREFDLQLLQLDLQKQQQQYEVDLARQRVDAAQAQVDLERQGVDAAQARVDIARQAVDAAQQLVTRAREQLTAAQANLQALKGQQQELKQLLQLELQRLEALAAQAREEAAAEAAAKKGRVGPVAGPERGYFEGIGTAAAGLGAQMDDLKAKWRGWLEAVAGPQLAQLRADFDKLKETIRGLFGLPSEGGEGEPYQTGVKLRDALIEIYKNANKLATIGTNVWHWLEGAKTWWDNLDPNLKQLLLVALGLQVFTGVPGIVISILGVQLVGGFLGLLARALATVGIFLAGEVFDLGVSLFVSAAAAAPGLAAAIGSAVAGVAGISLGAVAGVAGAILGTIAIALLIAGAIVNRDKVAQDVKDQNLPQLVQDIWEGTKKFLDVPLSPDPTGLFTWFRTVVLPVLSIKIIPDLSGIPDAIKRLLGLGGGPTQVPGIDASEAVSSAEQYEMTFARMSGDIVGTTSRMAADVAANFGQITATLKTDPGTAEQKSWWQTLVDALVGHSIVPDMVTGIIQQLTGLREQTISITQDMLNRILDLYTTQLDAIGNKVQEWGSFVLLTFDGLKRQVDADVQAMLDTARRAFDSFTSGSLTALVSWADSLKSTLDSLAKHWNDDFNGMADVVPSFLGRVDDIVAQFRHLESEIGNLVDKYNDLRRAVSNLPSAPTYNTPSAPSAPSTGGDTSTPQPGPSGGPFQTGGYVYNTAQYLLHAGEIVLNQQQQASLLAQMGLAGAGANMRVEVSSTHNWYSTPNLADKLAIQAMVHESTYAAVRKAFGG